MTECGDTKVDLVDDEFERLGRLAGAELRQPAPADGAGTVMRSAHRRRAKVAVVSAGVTVAIVVTGLLVANSRIQDEPAPIATVPPTPSPVVQTTTPPDLEDVTPPDAARTTTPGTWRAVEDPLALAPDFPSAAVWTGTDVIVIGSNWTDASELSPPTAAAHDVGRDRWRRLADPPPALRQESSIAEMQWTGSEVLAATSQGEVYGYDPARDRWESRAAADESMSLPAANALVAVSGRGVLARSSSGWWWYENSTDRWESVPSPPDDDGGYSMLAVLDQDRIVAAHIDGARLTPAVFDTAARSWRIGPAAKTPVSDRSDPTSCDANDGLLVCWAEGFESLQGVVIDPLVGLLDTFSLGPHSSNISTRALPWMTHAWKLLAPRTATWEDLPPSPRDDVDGFTAAVWTGSEIVFLGGNNSGSTGGRLGQVAAYTPLQLPGR